MKQQLRLPVKFITSISSRDYNTITKICSEGLGLRLESNDTWHLNKGHIGEHLCWDNNKLSGAGILGRFQIHYEQT
jgi:hypothetical protein